MILSVCFGRFPKLRKGPGFLLYLFFFRTLSVVEG